jgi:hypothetical protein
MATFNITGSDGGIYQVEGPDEAGAHAAFNKMQSERGAWDKLTGATGPRHQLWPERVVRGVVGGAISGATLPGDVASGRASPDDVGRVLDLATLGMPINPAVRAGDRMIPGVSKVLEKQSPPTAEVLKDVAGAGFETARKSGVAFPSSAMARLGDVLEQSLQSKGILPEHAPTAYATIARLRNAPEGAVSTLSDVHNLRQAFGNAAGSTAHAKDAMAGSMGVELVDRVLKAAASRSDGKANPAQTLLDAIGNYAAASRSEAVTGRSDMAALRAKVANSGQNLDNATRQRFVDIASEGRAARGFSEEEIAQALRLAEGSRGTNAARFVGNALGGGGGLGMAVTSGIGAAGGAALGGPAGAGVGAVVGPIVGAGAKAVANAMTRREVAKLDEMVRGRSPLAESLAVAPGAVQGPRSGVEAISRILMEAEQSAIPREDAKGLIAQIMARRS